MLISMYLLSSTLTMNFCMRISSPVHVHRYKIYFNEHKGEIRTIGCIRGCGDNSLITCSRLEMFTLNIWDVIQLALCAIFVLNVFLVKKKNLFYIFFLLCAFVAMRNSSYRKTPCHQHWSEWCGKGFWLLEIRFCTYHNPNIFPICLALMVWVLSWRGVCMCESVKVRVTSIPSNSGNDRRSPDAIFPEFKWNWNAHRGNLSNIDAFPSEPLW